MRFPTDTMQLCTRHHAACAMARPTAARQLTQRCFAAKRRAGCGRSDLALDRAWPHKLCRTVLTGAACLSLLLQPAVAVAEELSIAFPASADPEIRRAQQTMVESWAYVQGFYLDPTFSHTDWSKALQDSLAASFKASSAAEVVKLTQKLLSSLGDPYTRLLQGDDAAALKAEEQGKIIATGLGLQPVLQLNSQLGGSNPQQTPNMNNTSIAAAATAVDAVAGSMPGSHEALVVSFVVDGSPAAAAGVMEGDVLLEVAGQAVTGHKLRQVYQLLSKETDVTLLRRPAADAVNIIQSNSSSATAAGATLPLVQLPSDAAQQEVSNNSSSDSSVSARQQLAATPGSTYMVHLKPQPIGFAPVQYGVINLDNLPSSGSSSSSSSSSGEADTSSSATSGSVGYVKLLTFAASAPQEVAEALVDLQQQQQLSGLILDLRDNPGGLIEAGVDIAQDFLQEGQVLCIAVDNSGIEEQVVLPSTHTLTKLPLVLLVNKSTASTAELVAGSLHDELKAPMIGETTYGKGRSQRVVQLSDQASTLLVSTLKYYTPQHTEIDKVGLRPEVACSPEEVTGQQWLGGKRDEEDNKVSLLDDPCIKLAAERLASHKA